VAYDPRAELIITVGASEAVDASLRALLDPGDEVIYHEPCFVAYAPCIQLAGGVPVRVATSDATGFAVRAEEIEAAVTPRTKAIFLGYPNNPTGAVLSREQLAAIAEVAARHDLVVISDEIYDRLVYGDHAHTAFSSLPGMRERTVLIGGFSKSYAMTGWRIGYVAAPAGLMTGIAKVHQYGIMCAPTSAQFAAVEALRTGEPFVQAMHDEYDRRRRLMTDRLNRMGLLCFEPKGAFYCFPNVTDATGLDEETFAQRLLAEERVAVVPGTAFGPSGAGHVRACYATAYEEIVEAMDRMARFVARCRLEG
jgi:aminotransferase